MKAAKALKEKGETPEELLQSIKENEAAVAEAQRVVDAWKAIVGEKSRREEAAKAEAERIATEKAEEEARVEAERKAEEERIAAEKSEERKERDENGQPFVVSSDGTTTFGEITEDTGLTAAPIKLSEGFQDANTGKGYGLVHIEANHGEQIRQAGFTSVKEFVSFVATHYDPDNIRVGKRRDDGSDTFLIQVTDTHDNTLFIELSKDGSYWNVNSGGIFRKGYSNKKETVAKTEPQQPTNAVSSDSSLSANVKDGITNAEPNGEPTVSLDKGTTLPADQQTSDKENTKKVADSEGENTLKAKIEAASADVNTEPTEAQKEAGNYKKGHVQVGTFDITIEQPEGSIRRGTDADGKKWESKMHNTYGYFRGTEGVDGDHIDVFLSNDIDGWNGRKVFVVDQYNPDGTFDEHKVMLGFNDMDEAKSDYLANYEKGWENGRRITVSTTNLEDFEKWIDSSHRKTKPFSEYSSVNKETVATDKGGEKPEKKQEKQSVFDKAKEIADKEEKKRKAEAEKQKVDKQGNPIDAEGRLITEKVEDISDLSDDDFNNPTRSVELPKIPKNVDDALGANGRPVIIKKNIFEKNGKSHGFTPKQSRKILGDALYNPDIVGQSQPSTKKTHWVAIKVDEKSPITILEVNDGKDNVEVVGWYTLDARNLERIKRQAEREGGELLVLSPKDKVESLPTPTSGLPTDKGSEVGGEKQEAEKKRPAPLSERIEDVGEKIGDARKDVWKEIIARIKNKKQGIEEALKKSSAGKLFSSLFDEKELLESGVSNEVVTFISAVKGSLGTKPRSLSKLKMWINKVLHQYDMCEQALENWESVKKKIDEWKYYSQPFYMYRAAMAVGGYESGRDVGNAELWQIADGYSDGKSVAGQWRVRKAGAYDGIYKTYEEAAEALKKFAGENAAVDGKGKRKEVKLAIYKRRTDGTMFIAPEGKPDVIIQDGFKTLYEASAYKKEHYAEMQERYRTLMDGIKPKFNENRERKGRDWRGGEDVSAEDFREAFDFRGVEFGNWMQQKDRRQALNECYDSLMDLAMVCGVSPKALSLGGKLAMAFGARGGGKFNAHYEPDKVVINLTKTKGAGSLAHEWFHAIDNYFNMQGWDEFATESTRNVERKEMAEAWKDLVRAINGSDYFKRSDKYARLKGSRYWIEPTELGARAFAVWVENRLSKYGTINDYLANNPRLVDEKASDAEKKYAPYPFDKDADWMDEKFGRLFEVMQERVDEETGKHILYSRNKAAGHENTELTAEERELRDNLVERMRKGGLDVVTDSEEMQRVIDTENERTRNMFVGEKGATEADKAEEVSTRLDNLSVARRMEEAEKNAKSIKMATGWERGTDGKWRYETGDAKIKDTIELDGKTFKRYDEDMLWTSGKFGDVVDAPELFKAYPELKDVRIETDAVLNDMPSNGEYNPRTNTITIHSDDLKYQNSILNHEIQHAIQHIEGFASGGNFSTPQLKDSKEYKDWQKMLDDARKPSFKEEDIQATINSLFKDYNDLDKKIKEFLSAEETRMDGTGKSLLKSRQNRLEEIGREITELVDELEREGKKRGYVVKAVLDSEQSVLFNLYNRLAGEVEARNTEKRIGMTEEERRASLASETEDVAREDQILLGVDNADGEMNTGSVREHRVYHGSGADFDAFDHSHMGEGEGAQAYGWGTYVTEVEGIGRTYAIQNTTTHNDALRALQHDVDAISDQLNRHRDDLKYDEEQLKRANEWRAEAELDYELFRDEAEELKEKYGEASPEYRNHLFNDIYTDEMKRAQSSVKSTEESIQYRKEKIAELEKALKDKQAEIDELPKEFPRHLYTVEIPDDNGSNYLDWNGHPAESLLKGVGSFLESNGFERVQDNPARYEKGESTVVLNPNATGADLYAELQEALGSDKKASQALAELGCIGIKYPADNMRGGRKDGAKNYVIFNENDAKITDHTRFLRTAGGEVYGLVKDGRIYLDPKVATSETAVHEYTHLWGDMLRRKDSEQWSHTVKELKNSVLWEEVKELYPELKTDDEIADEVLSTFSGRRGAERLREEARRVADGDGGVFTKTKAIETLERVKEAIARFWEGVARMFGINRYRSAEELADMAMRDLLDSKNPMKDESGMRKRGEVGETLATSGTYFSGGGLLEAGLKGVIDPKVAVEFSEKIAGVYADNHGNHIVVADVRDVDPKKLVGAVDGGEVQYFHASPVCKNFSKAKREGGEVELDKETALSTAEFIAKTRPKVVTIENVKGYRNSEALKIITDELTRQGYDWDADVYNAADYGGYTKRERLIVRAKRDGKLPPKPEKLPEELRKKGWYSAVEDLIPHLEEKKTGVPQGTDERLKNSGIDYRTIDKPLYVFGRGYANKTVGHAFADELLPTLTTGGGDIIIMPDGRVLKASPRVLARVTGLPDTYKMPETDQLSHTIVGNGIPTQLTEGVIAPLLDNAIPSAERATKRESVFDVADRVSQNLEERTRAMAVKKANDRFNEELEMQVKGELEEGHVYKLGMPSEILLSTGVPNLPIELSAKQLSKKAADRGHRFDVKDIANLPQAIQAPIAVFEYGNKDKSQNLIVEIERDGKKFVVGIHFNQNRRGIVVNDIRGLFNKDSHEWLNWISQGKLLYADKEKIQALMDKQRTNLAEVNYLNLDDVAKKVKDFENPKLFDGKISGVDKKGSDSIDRSVRENPKNEDKPRFSRKPGESIFDYASRVSEDVDRSVREIVSARDEYEKKVKSKGFQTKEALQNSMLGLQEFMLAIDHASGNKRYIEDIPDFENPILGENRLSSVNKEEMHQVAKTQFKPLMSAVAKLSGNGKESGELYDYMFAKHGLERDAVMRQREAQKEFDKYQKANPKGTKTIGDFVASLEGKDYAGLTALTAEDGRVKSIQSQIDAIDEQMEATDNQLLLRYLGGQKKRLKVDLLNAARDAADDIRKTFENNPSHDRSDINELWSRVNEVNGNTLRKLYESGMLTKEAYNDISSMYTNYIPMRGFDQTTSADAYAYLTHGDSAFNAPIKTAKGRSSKADNPIAYMQAMAESAIMQGNRNVLVKQKMLNFVRNHPSDLASVSDVWLQYDSVADEWKPVFPDNIDANDSASVVAKKMEAFEDKMKQMAEKHPDLVQRSNEAPDIPYKVVEKGQLNEHQVLVKQNGKSYIITVNGSPRAAQAANGLTNPDTDLTGAVGKVFEGAEALNRQLSFLYTTLNPDFIGSNYVRDALYSNTMVYVKEGAKYGGSFNFNFAKYNPAEMANLYASYNKGSLDTSNETHRLFLEFMQNGGETGFVNLKQIEKRKSEIAKAIKRDGRISAAQIWGGLSDAVDFANRAVENSARFAAYVTSRKSGRSVGRSVYDAKEISVNFNRKGSGRNWWKDNVGTSRFYDTEIGLVEINRASVGSSLAHRYSQVKLDVITSLAEGFNNAVYFGSMQDFNRQEGVKSHYFAYPINYNGNRNYVFCRAMQDANKSRLYVHEVFLADNIEKGNTLQTAASQPHGGITLYKDILANVLAANVTNDSETSKPCFSRKPGESIFDYASRVSEDVDRSVCEGR